MASTRVPETPMTVYVAQSSMERPVHFHWLLRRLAFETVAHFFERCVCIVVKRFVAERVTEDFRFGIRHGSIHIGCKLPFSPFVWLRLWCHETHVLLMVRIVDYSERP
jgi:hypothetical protein